MRRGPGTYHGEQASPDAAPESKSLLNSMALGDPAELVGAQDPSQLVLVLHRAKLVEGFLHWHELGGELPTELRFDPAETVGEAEAASSRNPR